MLAHALSYNLAHVSIFGTWFPFRHYGKHYTPRRKPTANQKFDKKSSQDFSTFDVNQLPKMLHNGDQYLKNSEKKKTLPGYAMLDK